MSLTDELSATPTQPSTDFLSHLSQTPSFCLSWPLCKSCYSDVATLTLWTVLSSTRYIQRRAVFYCVICVRYVTRELISVIKTRIKELVFVSADSEGTWDSLAILPPVKLMYLVILCFFFFSECWYCGERRMCLFVFLACCAHDNGALSDWLYCSTLNTPPA